MVEQPRKRPRLTKPSAKPIDRSKPKTIYPRMITRDIPKIVWEPVHGVITDNGNFVFYRRAIRSRNVFWTVRTKPAKKDGLYYMPDVFHKIMGWVYLTKESRLARDPKPMWGDAKSYPLPRVRTVDDTTVNFAISELKRAAGMR